MNKLILFRKIKGSLSVFISSILIPFILIFSMVCESARLGTQKAMYASALYVSSYSTLASYCLELYTDYGIFALQKDEEKITETCSRYLSKNLLTESDITDLYSSFYKPESFSLSVDNISYITGDDGRLFAKSAINYSKDTLISDAADFVISNFHTNAGILGTSKELPLNPTNIDLSSTDKDTLSKTTEKESKNKDSYMDIIKNTVASADTPSANYNDLTELFTTFFSMSLLSFVTPNPTKLSKLAVKKAVLPSETKKLSKQAAEEYTPYNRFTPTKNSNIIADGLDKTFFVRYLSKEFTCYTDTLEDDFNNDLPLLYQLEYILFGEETDLYNLLYTAIALVITRAQLNFAYILTDSEKVSSAKALATETFVEFAIPGLIELATLIILIVWSVAESVIDCRDLMSSKKVPLIKSKATWTLSLENISSISDVKSKNKGNSGLSYKDYILCLFMFQNNTDTYFKTMDVIQVCIEHKYDTYFRMNECVYGFKTTLTTNNSHIFNYWGKYFYDTYKLTTTLSLSY